MAGLSLVLFIAAWHSNTLEETLAPVLGLMSASGIVYTALLGWRFAVSGAGEPATD